MFSRSLGRETSYMAWLPPGYASSTQTYPTLYLLHGVGGPDGYGVEEWLGYALTEDLDRMLAVRALRAGPTARGNHFSLRPGLRRQRDRLSGR